MAGIRVLPCGPNANIGEKITADFLKDNLPSGTVLMNYYLPARPRTLEIDAVVINKNGVYLLEVKHWRGRIVGDHLHWRHSSGALRRNPIPLIENKAKIMHGFLGAHGWPNVSTMGMVVLSNGIDAFSSSDPSAYKVFGLDSMLIDALTGPDFVFRPTSRKLRRQHIDELQQLLANTDVSDAAQVVAHYEVTMVESRDHYKVLRGQHLEIPKQRVRIKQYDVENISSTREFDVAVERFKREMNALVEVAGRHPNLVLPYDFLRDENSDDRYYLILEWCGGQTLADLIQADSLPVRRQIKIIKDVAAALDHCHQHGVYHRNLSPGSVYILPNGVVRVGDFDFAKVPTISRTYSLTTGQLPHGWYLAPEQIIQAHTIDQRADIFSLGAIWYAMLVGNCPEDGVNYATIDEVDFPKRGKDLLRKLLAQNRADRPESMQDVRESLENLAF